MKICAPGPAICAQLLGHFVGIVRQRVDLVPRERLREAVVAPRLRALLVDEDFFARARPVSVAMALLSPRLTVKDAGVALEALGLDRDLIRARARGGECRPAGSR